MDWRAALVLSSLIYAILHFIGRTDDAGAVTWSSGLELLPRMFSGVGDSDSFPPMFASLTLVGIMLGLAYQRTGNLYFSIALHAGWIFWLKSYGLLTVQYSDAHQWFWGTQKLIDGWAALIVLTAVLFVMLRLPEAKDQPRA
jgi:hypothetical protein